MSIWIQGGRRRKSPFLYTEKTSALFPGTKIHLQTYVHREIAFSPWQNCLIKKKKSKHWSYWGKREIEEELLIQPLTKLKTWLMLLIFVLPLHFTVVSLILSLPCLLPHKMDLFRIAAALISWSRTVILQPWNLFPPPDKDLLPQEQSLLLVGQFVFCILFSSLRGSNPYPGPQQGKMNNIFG